MKQSGRRSRRIQDRQTLNRRIYVLIIKYLIPRNEIRTFGHANLAGDEMRGAVIARYSPQLSEIETELRVPGESLANPLHDELSASDEGSNGYGLRKAMHFRAFDNLDFVRQDSK